MTYRVKLHPKVTKFLKKLDNHIEERIREKLHLLHHDPFHYLEHYESENCYKFRIGDYRTLIDINKQRKLVFVRVLNHRKNIYKKK